MLTSMKFKSEGRQEMMGQFIKFCIVGFSNAGVSLVIYYFFIWIRDDVTMAMLGWTIGWILGVLNSFIWNRVFVFKESEELWWRALLKMYIGYGFTLLISLILTYVQVEWLNISTIIVPIVNIAINIPLNFIIVKYWSFEKYVVRRKT